MASIPFTSTGCGRYIELGSLPRQRDGLGTDNLILVLAQGLGAATDTILRNCTTYAAMITAGWTEATFTNYCVDPDTECLTRRLGWTRYEQLVSDDEVLAYDQEAHVTRWERLDGIYVDRNYQGPMWRLNMRGFSAVTTPNHRWPVLQQIGFGSDRKRVAHTLTTETLPARTIQNWLLMRSAPFVNDAEPIYTDEFVRIAAWYFTEGCLIRGGKSVTISQSATHNPEHVEEIRRDLKALGAVAPDRPVVCTLDECDRPVDNLGLCESHYRREYRKMRKAGQRSSYAGRHRSIGLFVTERVRRDDQLVTWDLFGTDVDPLIAVVPGKHKVPTAAFLSALTPAQARMFVEVCLAADGTKGDRSFQQHNTARMDAFMQAAVLAGLGPTVSADGTSCCLNEAFPTIRLHRVRREQFDYAGPIWCPMLPSGFWVARRAGKTFITGNSPKVLGPSDLSVTYVTAPTGGNPYTASLSLVAAQIWNPAGGAINNAAIVKSALLYRPTPTTPLSSCTGLGLCDATGGATGGSYTHTFGTLTSGAT